jgi:hypothetical protein
MSSKKQKHRIDEERIRQNLMAWVDVTTLCIELRKSVLKAKYSIDDDEELTRMVFAEAVTRKEKAWKFMKRSQNISETF